jgi:hypothetical protein
MIDTKAIVFIKGSLVISFKSTQVNPQYLYRAHCQSLHARSHGQPELLNSVGIYRKEL